MAASMNDPPRRITSSPAEAANGCEDAATPDDPTTIPRPMGEVGDQSMASTPVAGTSGAKIVFVNEHALRVLEWPSLLARLASHAATGLGREAALSLAPFTDMAGAAAALRQTREARLAVAGDGLPLGGIRDIRQVIAAARVDRQLVPVELLDVASTVQACRRLRTTLLRRTDTWPCLADIASGIPHSLSLDARILDCISENADVRDDASAELSSVRSRKRTVAARLTEKLNAFLVSPRYRPMLQEAIITTREGRQCVAVKAEHRAHVGGIVHDASASGATLFMEPGSCVPLGNELRELAVKEEQEVSRILTRLTGLVASAYDDLQAMLARAAALDLAAAKGILAEAMAAVEPELATDGFTRIVAGRHPLLPEPVVPIDVEVGGAFTVLLLTGPNTGGKTVALKTVGLATLMAQSGLQVPAAQGTRISLVDNVFADVGDEQDIQQSLSTFSSHLRNIVALLKDLGERSLVLLDEIGAGTDPAEGAAIAKAVLRSLQDRGARVIATTHYGELKEFAYERDGVENAAVEFDRETLRPTYRVLMGVPGSSHALYIARRLGLPREVIDDARQGLRGRGRSSAEVLQRIEKLRKQAMEHERDAAQANQEARKSQSEYQRRLDQITDVQRTVKRQAEEEARALLRRTSDKAEGIIDELRRAGKGQRKAPDARKKLTVLRQETHAELGAAVQPEPEPPPAPEGHTYRQGDRVFVTSLQTEGVLLEECADGFVPVQIGAMRATLPVSAIRPVVGAEPPKPKQDTGASRISMRKAIQISPELTVRAMRADEATAMLDRYIDDAYTAGLREARVIHGRGTGVLRRMVAEYLKTSPVVAGFRVGEESEGGDGVTIVSFKH